MAPEGRTRTCGLKVEDRRFRLDVRNDFFPQSTPAVEQSCNWGFSLVGSFQTEAGWSPVRILQQYPTLSGAGAKWSPSFLSTLILWMQTDMEGTWLPKKCYLCVCFQKLLVRPADIMPNALYESLCWMPYFLPPTLNFLPVFPCFGHFWLPRSSCAGSAAKSNQNILQLHFWPLETPLLAVMSVGGSRNILSCLA